MSVRKKSIVCAASLSVSLLPAAWSRADDVSTADAVTQYTPGTSVTQTYWGASYAGPSSSWTSGPGIGLPKSTINLADDEDNGIFGDNSVVTPFNPQYNPASLVGLGGNGGYIQLHLSQPISTAGATLGVHVGMGLNDVNYPTGTNGSFGPGGVVTPIAEDFGNPRSALVLVSQVGGSNPANWVALNNGQPVSFTMPTNVFTDVDAPYTNDLGSTLADFGKPFLVGGKPATLSAFDGKDWPGTLSVLNGSAGGTWLDLSGVPLSQVNYVAFETQGSESMLLDSLVGSLAAGPPVLTWNGAASAIWTSGSTQNWNGTSGAVAFADGNKAIFDDSNTGGTNVNISGTVHPLSVAIGGSKNYIFSGNGTIADQSAGPTTLSLSGTGSLTITNVNTYSGITTIGSGLDSPTFALASSGRIASQSLAVNAGATAIIDGLLTGTPEVTVDGALTLGANDNVNGKSGQVLVQSWGPLIVASSGSVRLTPTTPSNHASRIVLVTSELSNAGRIDLANNDLVIQNTPADSAILNQLKAGFNSAAGYWNGATGIVSSSAAGDTHFLTTIGYRQSAGGWFDLVNTSSSDTLLKYTYYGDADLSGSVDGADYHQIDLGFGNHLTGWSNGDFNYDGVVDGSDYALIDNTFNQLTASGLSSAPLAELGTAVPEPAMAALAALLGLHLLQRRRKHI